MKIGFLRSKILRALALVVAIGIGAAAAYLGKDRLLSIASRTGDESKAASHSEEHGSRSRP